MNFAVFFVYLSKVLAGGCECSMTLIVGSQVNLNQYFENKRPVNIFYRTLVFDKNYFTYWLATSLNTLS